MSTNIHHAAQSIPGERPHVAVLVLVIDVTRHVVVSATTLGPNPAVHDPHYRYAEVARCGSSTSYTDARERLLEYVRTHEPWILPLLGQPVRDADGT